MLMFFCKYRVSIILFLFFFAVTLALLFLGPKIGLANNEDFDRVLSAVGFELPNENEYDFHYVDKYNLKFLKDSFFIDVFNTLFYNSNDASAYISTQYLYIKLSIFLSLLVKSILGVSTKVFELGYLGLVYSCVYAIALTLLCMSNFTHNRVYNLLMINNIYSFNASYL